MANLTGVPDLMSSLNLAGSNANQLSEEEMLARKKKLMAAGQSNDFQSAMSLMFGDRLNAAGTPRV